MVKADRAVEQSNLDIINKIQINSPEEAVDISIINSTKNFKLISQEPKIIKALKVLSKPSPN